MINWDKKEKLIENVKIVEKILKACLSKERKHRIGKSIASQREN